MTCCPAHYDELTGYIQQSVHNPNSFFPLNAHNAPELHHRQQHQPHQLIDNINHRPLIEQIQCRRCRNVSGCNKTRTWVVTLASVNILLCAYFPGGWRYCWLTAPLRRTCYGEKGCISIIITREKTKLSQGAPSPGCEARPLSLSKLRWWMSGREMFPLLPKQSLRLRDGCCDRECHSPVAVDVNWSKYQGYISDTRPAASNNGGYPESVFFFRQRRGKEVDVVTFICKFKN